jgi:Na+/melibiose symporter-like transporter
MAPFAMVGGVIAGIVYLGYRIDKVAHAEIQKRLNERAVLARSES